MPQGKNNKILTLLDYFNRFGFTELIVSIIIALPLVLLYNYYSYRELLHIGVCASDVEVINEILFQGQLISYTDPPIRIHTASFLDPRHVQLYSFNKAHTELMYNRLTKLGFVVEKLTKWI